MSKDTFFYFLFLKKHTFLSTVNLFFLSESIKNGYRCFTLHLAMNNSLLVLNWHDCRKYILTSHIREYLLLECTGKDQASSFNTKQT